MDIHITEEGKFYTVNLETELASNWVKLNHNIDATMRISDALFFISDESEAQEFITKTLKSGLTISLNSRILELNPDNAIVYALERNI